MNFREKVPSVSSEPSVPTVDSGEPMQIGRTRLSPAERQHRMDEGRCIYCGQFGHFLASCPVRKNVGPIKSSVLVSSATVKSCTNASLPRFSLLPPLVLAVSQR
ncbi:hypothetical protein NL108_011115 [Boleophthalmus pectinirostris]|nr:hypothetical protein NL108_011115 [Boleophthalmus pectinirostris]